MSMQITLTTQKKIYRKGGINFRRSALLVARQSLKKFNFSWYLLPFALLLTAATTALGAEKIYVNYGPLEFSVSVSSLETYARSGVLDGELAAYASRLTPEQLAQFRQLLVTRIDADPVAVAQFLYSPQGEIILQRVSRLVQTRAGQPGFSAIRAALILAAADKEQGFTLLNILKKFPTYGIRVDSAQGFAIIDRLATLIRETKIAIAAVEQQSLTEAAQTPINTTVSPTLADLRQPGTVTYETQSLTLNDVSRNRTFPVDVYLPNLGGSLPLIVISHGLGGDRQTYRYLAQHLASYGFAVAVLEHPGSNAAQLQALVTGLTSEITSPYELINRPLDIKFLLNEMGRTYGERVNLQRVGVIGQSFGGYTALALLGAQLNLQQIRQACQIDNNSLNLSLLLQCSAISLIPVDYPLQDERVQAAIAINPIDSIVFGEDQIKRIQAPLMLVSSSADTVAPPVLEQIQPFTQLTTPNKYLALLVNGTHFSTLGQSTNDVPLPERVIGPDPAIAQDYMKALSVAFFQTYIALDSRYQPYLSAAYAQSISKSPMPLNLIRSLTPEQLREGVGSRE